MTSDFKTNSLRSLNCHRYDTELKLDTTTYLLINRRFFNLNYRHNKLNSKTNPHLSLLITYTSKKIPSQHDQNHYQAASFTVPPLFELTRNSCEYGLIKLK